MGASSLTTSTANIAINMSLGPLIIAIKNEYVKSRNAFAMDYKNNTHDLNDDEFHHLFENEIQDKCFGRDPFYSEDEESGEILTIYQNLKCDQVIDMLRYIQESHQDKYAKPYIQLCNEKNLLKDFMEFRFYDEKDNDDMLDNWVEIEYDTL